MSYSEKIINRYVEKFSNEDLWINLGEMLIKVIVIVILAGIAIRIGKSIIRKFFLVRSKSPLRISERREATILKLLENILTYVLFFIAFMMVLEALTIDVKALLAGAGIVGLAVGFGAQSLVKDVITGFFIILEDQFSVGDYVRIGQFEGTVEEIGLRTSKVKSFTGEVHIIPNGNILEVTNFSIHNSVAVVDVSIAYEGDMEFAERVIKDLLINMKDKYEDLVKDPELLGVQTLGPSEVVYRVTAETAPMKHFFISRVLRKEIKQCLDENGIEIPFPRMVMYNRQDEPGTKQRG
ncbi:mechanosensitive ion channel family protein [Peribacillus acanthi]|uniref:mechanosensitive ion channel family protein n=1 Tax=Peribacillus acanthi TaxID=2171554 RepID=UPI000D3EBA92|nr:mechanosensitive ion channel family protein [Peribacillus acanthi]